ncbi:MAG: magnetochrome domain-containing protein [Actinomycetota bacterium]|nr:magnetochrome domain-containing protein [Actinomycetota bacterium]
MSEPTTRTKARMIKSGIIVTAATAAVAAVVALAGAAPVIAPGAVAPHGYRGTCTTCHTYSTPAPAPVPDPIPVVNPAPDPAPVPDLVVTPAPNPGHDADDQGVEDADDQGADEADDQGADEADEADEAHQSSGSGEMSRTRTGTRDGMGSMTDGEHAREQDGDHNDD